MEESNDSLEKLLYIFVCNDSNVLDRVYLNDKIMDKVRGKLDSIIYDFDGTLYYDKQEFVEEASFNYGKEEGTKETAKSLLKMGVNTIEQIAEATGLSVEEINSLKNDMQ